MEEQKLDDHPESKERHEDSFEIFVRVYYMKMLVLYHRYILLGWIGLMIVCFIYGPKFLTNTRFTFSFIFALYNFLLCYFSHLIFL